MIEYRLYFKIEGKTYYAGSIRTLNNKIEMFYHFPWGSRSPSEYQNSKEQIDKWHLPDHISFHKNGKIHLKIKDEKKKGKHIDPIDIKLNPFNLKYGKFLPLFLESFFIEKRFFKRRFKLEEPITKNSYVWDIKSLKSFSLLIVSKCASVHPVKMTKIHEGLNRLKIIDKPLLIKNFFTKEEKESLINGSNSERSTELVIYVFRETIPRIKPIYDTVQGEGLNVNTFHTVPTLEHLEMLRDINI